MMFEKEIRVSHFFRNIPDPDVQKLIRDENNNESKIKSEIESIQRRLKPEKYSESSQNAIVQLDFYLTKWDESCNQSDRKITEGLKYRLVTWLLCNPNITTNQLSEDTLDLLKKFDRYYEINKNNQMIF